MIVSETYQKKNVPPELQEEFFDLMPHGPGIRCLDRIVEIGTNYSLCVARVGKVESMLLANDKGVIASSALEYIAQAALAGRITSELERNANPGGVLPTATSKVPGGTIVRVDTLELNELTWTLGQALLVESSWGASVGGAFKVSGRVIKMEDREIVLATAEFTILEFG